MRRPQFQHCGQEQPIIDCIVQAAPETSASCRA